MKRGFTLMEVTLAMLVMAGGILSVVSLYSYGYRESSQSREDVASTVYAEAVLSALVTMCSSTNVTWSSFNSVKSTLTRGWGDYLNSTTWAATSDPQGLATREYEAVQKKMPEGITMPQLSSATGMKPALVIKHDMDSPVIKFCFRAVKNGYWGTLMAMPMFYAEAHFQGVPE